MSVTTGTDDRIGLRITAAVKDHRRSRRRASVVIVILAVLTGVVLIADLSVGSDGIRIPETMQALLSPSTAPAIEFQIVWEYRMPMTLLAILAGAGLALSGAQMQTILNNPLAEPYTLGVSAAAGFGAALGLVLGVDSLPFGDVLGTAGLAWVFAVISSGVILLVSLTKGGGTETMVLLGIAMVFLFGALLALMQYMASEAQLQQVLFWTLGSLGRAKWSSVALLAVILLAVIPVLLRLSWPLTALRLGSDRAQALGVRVLPLQMAVLLLVSLVAATTVSIAGSIGFIGLVGPHVARLLVGEEHRFFIPASLMTGAIVLCGSSMVGRLLVPGVLLPVGIITAIIGVPLFLTLTLARKGPSWA